VKQADRTAGNDIPLSINIEEGYATTVNPFQ
jgi:hypothetical protein